MSSVPFTLSEFRNWVDQLDKIIQDCHISLFNLERLCDYSDPRTRDFIRLPFSAHLKEQYRFTLITQLDKLFSRGKNQELAFFHLFNAIEERGFAPEVVQSWQQTGTPWRDLPGLMTEVNKLRSALLAIAENVRRVTVHRGAVTAHTQASPPEGFYPTNDDLELLNLHARNVCHLMQVCAMVPVRQFKGTGNWDISEIMKAYQYYVEHHK